MNDYIIFKNLDGKYLTLKECLEENKEKHENTVFCFSIIVIIVIVKISHVIYFLIVI